MKKTTFQLITDNGLSFLGRVKKEPTMSLSTVELPNGQYESCIFYSDGNSEILDSYDTRSKAIIGHFELEKQFKLSRPKDSMF
jgi:hypothetical protein